MKNDLISKRILSVCLGVSALLVSGSLFMFSIQPAKADANTNLPVLGVGNGNIMMDYTSVHVPSQDKTYYECMVWNTETGQSKLYFYSYSDKRFKAYESNVQLPSNPLD